VVVRRKEKKTITTEKRRENDGTWIREHCNNTSMRNSPQAIGVAGRLCSISEISPKGGEEVRERGEMCGREGGSVNVEGEEMG
jgi:hypothetical protein